MTNNPFEQLAEAQINSPTRAKLRAAEKRAAKQPMVPTPQEQELIDRSKQMRSYARWKRAEAREHLAEPYREHFRELRQILRDLKIEGPQVLVDYVTRAAWLEAAPHATRAVVLDIIATRISRLRVQNGYPPIDDSLPGEEPTAFEIIRAHLNTFTKPTEPT